MAIERTAHPYIIRDSALYEGEPIIEGTKTGVRHVILLFQSGKDPEEIANIHRLSLAQEYDINGLLVSSSLVVPVAVYSCCQYLPSITDCVRCACTPPVKF